LGFEDLVTPEALEEDPWKVVASKPLPFVGPRPPAPGAEAAAAPPIPKPPTPEGLMSGDSGGGIKHAAGAAWDELKNGPANLAALGNTIRQPFEQPAGESKMKSALRGMGSAVFPPLAIRDASAVGAMGQPMVDTGKQAAESFQNGDYIKGTRRAINTGINALAPGLGSGSERAAQAFDEGDLAGGLGRTAGVGVNAALMARGPQVAQTAAELPGRVGAKIAAGRPKVPGSPGEPPAPAGELESPPAIEDPAQKPPQAMKPVEPEAPEAIEQAAQAAPSGIVKSLDNTAAQAMERIRQRGTFSGTRMNAAVPVDDMADMAIWGASKIAKGTVKFGPWAKEMIADSGGKLDPQTLKEMFAASQGIYQKHVENTAGKLKSTKYLLSLYQKGIDGQDWYKHTKVELEQHFGSDAPIFVDFLAATSPNASVVSNVGLALKAYTQYKTGKPFTGYMPAVIGNLERAAQGISPNGPKVSSFKANLFGATEPVTIDRWMARAMGWPRDNITPAQYKFLDYAITQVAKKAGVEPRQMQTAIWKAIKQEQGLAGASAESFEQILARQIKTNPELAQVIQQLRGMGAAAPPQ
jgi:hypothetical protein